MEQINKKIIWIDDDIEKMFLRPYLDEFQDNNFTIIAVPHPDMINEVLKHNKDFSAIILDVLMPTGHTVDFEEAGGGLSTGLVVLKGLLNNEITRNKPIILFTNVDNIDDNGIDSLIKQNKNVKFLLKNDYFSDTFVKEVKNIINQ